MYCKNCGKEIPEDARFCPQCGTPQDVATDNVQNDAPEQNAPAPPPASADIPRNAEGAAPHGQGIVCPKCGSTDLKIERFTWWGGIVGAALANRLSCKSCGHKFKIQR